MKTTTKTKIKSVVYWLLGILSICAVCRTTHYYITTYTDNSVNDYAVVKVEEIPNNLKN